jgi:ABC-type uncharacterized transport system substrate-binding protein
MQFDPLLSYGNDFIDNYRRAATYVDGILKGEKPADLPVQAPTGTRTSTNRQRYDEYREITATKGAS